MEGLIREETRTWAAAADATVRLVTEAIAITAEAVVQEAQQAEPGRTAVHPSTEAAVEVQAVTQEAAQAVLPLWAEPEVQAGLVQTAVTVFSLAAEAAEPTLTVEARTKQVAQAEQERLSS